MKSQTVKTIGGVMSAVALISGGAGVAQAATIEPAAAAPAAATTLAAADAADTEAPARAVEGTFSYTQDAVSSNAEIGGVFCKAAATLCASLPTYGCEAVKAAAVTVAGPNASFTATVDELAGEEEATSYVMACSCATNVAGGGAIANAAVEGVSLETLVQMACASAVIARIQAIARDTLDAETSSAPQALVFAGPFSYPLGSQTLETPPRK